MSEDRRNGRKGDGGEMQRGSRRPHRSIRDPCDVDGRVRPDVCRAEENSAMTDGREMARTGDAGTLEQSRGEPLTASGTALTYMSLGFYAGEGTVEGLVLMAAVISAIFIVLWARRSSFVTGRVTYGGKGLKGTWMEYTVDGGGRRRLTVRRSGRYAIKVRRDSEVVIESLVRSGYIVRSGSCRSVRTAKLRTRADFEMVPD